MKHHQCIAVCITALFLIRYGTCMQQGREKPLLDRRVSYFEVRKGRSAARLPGVVRDLALVENLSICLEIISEKSGGSVPIAPSPMYLEYKTVREILDPLVEESGQEYFYEEDRGIINMIPIQTKRIKHYPLDHKLDEFQIKDVPLLWIGRAINEQAGAELVAFNSSSTGFDYLGWLLAERVTLQLKEVTVREILNEIVRTLGTGRFRWSSGFSGRTCVVSVCGLSWREMDERMRIFKQKGEWPPAK